MGNTRNIFTRNTPWQYKQQRESFIAAISVIKQVGHSRPHFVYLWWIISAKMHFSLQTYRSLGLLFNWPVFHLPTRREILEGWNLCLLIFTVIREVSSVRSLFFFVVVFYTLFGRTETPLTSWNVLCTCSVDLMLHIRSRFRPLQKGDFLYALCCGCYVM